MGSGARHHEDEELSLDRQQVVVVLCFARGLLESRLMHAGTTHRVSRGLGLWYELWTKGTNRSDS